MRYDKMENIGVRMELKILVSSRSEYEGKSVLIWSEYKSVTICNEYKSKSLLSWSVYDSKIGWNIESSWSEYECKIVSSQSEYESKVYRVGVNMQVRLDVVLNRSGYGSIYEYIWIEANVGCIYVEVWEYWR